MLTSEPNDVPSERDAWGKKRKAECLSPSEPLPFSPPLSPSGHLSPSNSEFPLSALFPLSSSSSSSSPESLHNDKKQRSDPPRFDLTWHSSSHFPSALPVSDPFDWPEMSENKPKKEPIDELLEEIDRQDRGSLPDDSKERPPNPNEADPLTPKEEVVWKYLVPLAPAPASASFSSLRDRYSRTTETTETADKPGHPFKRTIAGVEFEVGDIVSFCDASAEFSVNPKVANWIALDASIVRFDSENSLTLNIFTDSEGSEPRQETWVTDRRFCSPPNQPLKHVLRWGPNYSSACFQILCVHHRRDFLLRFTLP